MKKKLISVLCAFVLLVAAVPAASALSGEQLRAADTLYTLNLIQGTGEEDSYALSSPATRVQAVTVLVRLAAAEADAKNDAWISGFLDVPAWAEKTVDYAAHQKWISGVSPIKFSPESAVTPNAYCAFLLRMLGYSDQSGDFTVSDAFNFARRIGLVSRDYTGTLSRGDLFEITAGVLSFHYKDSEETVLSRLISKGVSSRASANALGLLTTELTARQAADRYTSAVFQLDGYEKQAYVDAGTPSSNASGFFISADGLAVTNYHSIEDDIYATATLSNGETYPIESVIYYDADIDVAVVRVSRTSVNSKTTSRFAALELADPSDLCRGDIVYSIGNPLGLGLSISSGVISDTARTVAHYKLPCIMDTADISKGSSGGALLNVYGQVVGVTSGAYTYGNSMYLAVPIAPVLSADLTVKGKTLPEVAAIQAAADAAAAEAAA